VLTSNRPRKSFRDAGERIFRQEADVQPGIISLLSARTPTAVRDIPIEKVIPNPGQPRMTWHEDTLAELAASIREHGVLQPILVRPAGDEYEIIAGERRWRAAQRAGLHEIPIVPLEATDAEALELAIIENVQRTDLNALEEAGGYQRLASEYGHSHEAIAHMVGKSRSHVSNTMRLLKLPETVKAYISAGEISAGAARMLVAAPDPEGMARQIVERGLNVRQVEALAKERARKPEKSGTSGANKSADTAALERRLSDTLGLTVTLAERGNRGVLHIHFRSLDQLEDVVRRLEKN
jgi:ParB family transcriptional regulator, chromosome partitioning protein